MGQTGRAKFLRFAGVALCIAGLLAWLWACNIWDRYYEYLPRTANPVTGNIHPLNIHGRVVYETLRERSRRESWDFWSTAVFCLGMALGAVYKWVTGKPGARTP